MAAAPVPTHQSKETRKKRERVYTWIGGITFLLVFIVYPLSPRPATILCIELTEFKKAAFNKFHEYGKAEAFHQVHGKVFKEHFPDLPPLR